MDHGLFLKHQDLKNHRQSSLLQLHKRLTFSLNTIRIIDTFAINLENHKFNDMRIMTIRKMGDKSGKL